MMGGAGHALVEHTVPIPDNSTGDNARPHPVSENISRIVDLEEAARRDLTGSERVSKVITDFAGSLRFVILHIAVFAGWTSWNTLAPQNLRFDPFPFGLMTMLVSLEGVFLATFVLISQNRMMAQSERRDHLGLQVNLLTEQELTMVLRMLRQWFEHAGMPPPPDHQHRVEELMEETNVSEVMQRIDEELPKE
jgi:uncharacterized membrane protein